MSLFIVLQTKMPVNKQRPLKAKLQQKGGICRFMRRKSTTSDMMKSYIVDALLILMAQKDYTTITVGEIVEKAGVNRSTYYRHFEKKEDVIKYFLDKISEDILEWDKEKESSFEEHLLNVYRHYFKHKTQMLTIYKNQLSILFLDTLKKYLGAETHIDKPASIQYDIAFHIGGTFNHFMLWFSRDMRDSPEEMVTHTLAILPNSLIDQIWNVPN